MSMKRFREGQDVTSRPPAKRSRVNTDLAKIWEQLADEDEDVRLEAASDLLKNHLSSQDVETARTIAKRLFRGLCSSRKAARLGFYVALVGALSTKPGPFQSQELQLEEVLSILESQTMPESGTHGQDERDHNFGRLMACKAVLDSKILLNSKKDYDAQYDQFSKTICALMAEKPWLRPEATSILTMAFQNMNNDKSSETSKAAKLVRSLFKQLKEHKLLRTIDSVGLWLAAREQFPTAEFPRDAWTKNDPLNVKDVQDLKRVLLDRKSKVADDDEVLGDSGWSPTLHPTWQIILRDLSSSQNKKRISFSQFWQDVVENGYFDPSSTPERKRTGLLILEAALEQVEKQHIGSCFSTNVVATLTHSLMKQEETYLFNTVKTILSRLVAHVTASPKSRGHEIILGLVQGSNYVDFDIVTKSTLLNDLYAIVGIDHNQSIGKLFSWVKTPPSEKTPKKHKDPKVERTRKNLLNICHRAICQAIRSTADEEDEELRSTQREQMLETIQHLLRLKRTATYSASQPPFDMGTVEFLREKIASIYEVLLTTDVHGKQLFLRLPMILRENELQAEEDIKTIVERSWLVLERMSEGSFQHSPAEANQTHSGTKARHKKLTTHQEGFAIPFALLLHEVYDGDGNSTEILGDILSAEEEFGTGDGDTAKAAMQITEIVLSLTSRSSRLFRRAGGLIFEAFSAHISADSLQSLCDILFSKENREGQQELFEADVDGYDESGADDDEDESQENSSSSDEWDSDVEIIEIDEEDEEQLENGQHEDSDANSDSASSSNSGNESEIDDGKQNDELTKFEDALAKALGTRKLNRDDLDQAEENSGDTQDSSDSDADMSDSEMVHLDEKLAELFKNQQSQLSAQRLRKQEMRSAKESVVNLKNRALDLIDLFLRFEQNRVLECVQLLVATFQMVVQSNSQQLTNRGIEFIRNFVPRWKGSKLPTIDQAEKTKRKLASSLARLHTFLLPSGLPDTLSNASIEAASLLNILLCRLLDAAGDKGVVDIVNGVSEFQKTRRIDPRQATAKFWSQYDQWVTSSGQKSEFDKRPSSAQGSKTDRTKIEGPATSKSTKSKKTKKEKTGSN